MTSILFYTILSLSALGALLAIILYFVAQKFKVTEDPRIDLVAAVLPGANCGGCGSAGCRAFAEKCVKADDLNSCYCPVGGNAGMKKVAEVLGKAVEEKLPMVAALRCNGSCEVRPKNTLFDGTASCAVQAQLYNGETACAYGCLGLGDCVSVCRFGALSINPLTCLVEIDEEKCSACGVCSTACPKGLLELRKKGPKNRRVYVACSNKDKGALARKACKAGCIACQSCVKVCAFEAISITDNLARIDPDKCRLCRKCVAACPVGCILEMNFPPKKENNE